MASFEMLRLENQLCFPLYACAKEVVRQYKPLLDRLGLTYTQYITLMVLWEDRSLTVKELGSRLFLDSGTLTPLLKKLESMGAKSRKRDPDDERSVIVAITEKGMELRDKALSVPDEMGSCLKLSESEIKELYGRLYQLLENLGR